MGYNGGMSLYSLYLHIPFCRRRCGYCDFNTYAGQGAQIPAYVTALCRELRGVAQAAGENLRVHTVYFGGGTPSLLEPDQVARILAEIRAGFDLQADAEITLEANPGTVTQEGLCALRAAGVNRISLGMQSALPAELATLDRQHHPGDVGQAVGWARKAGINNLSLDLIYGIPGQTLPGWQASLEAALELRPQHLSLYSLTLEPGTPLQRRVAGGQVASPEDDLAADQYELAMDQLAAAGYEQYEISNWARRNAAGELLCSRHNLQYWLGEPYLGLGAGAHGYAGGFRTANVLRIGTYLNRMVKDTREVFPFSPANASRVAIDRKNAMQETMMVGLRLTQVGVSRERFLERFGVEMESVFGPEIDLLTQQGLLEWSGGHESLRLTRRGRLLGNRVFREFVG